MATSNGGVSQPSCPIRRTRMRYWPGPGARRSKVPLGLVTVRPRSRPCPSSKMTSASSTGAPSVSRTARPRTCWLARLEVQRTRAVAAAQRGLMVTMPHTGIITIVIG